MSALMPVEKFRHEALLYSGLTGFVSGTVPFIRAGVQAGEPVLVVEALPKIAILREALGRDAGGVMFADMAKVGGNPARIIPAWQDFVAQGGGRRLRGIGEPIWNGRPAEELVECQRHESLLNVAFGTGQPWWLLCPYDTNMLEPNVIDEARRSHEYVTEAGRPKASDDFRGVDASGAPFDAPLPAPGSDVTTRDFDGSDLATIRYFVASGATRGGLSGGRVDDLVVAANEIAVNSVRHGGGSGTISIWREPGRVVCEVADRGHYELPLGDRTFPADAKAPRGLWLANQMCDLVQIRSFLSGTVVRLHMRVGPRPRLKVLRSSTNE